jgi:hypothetical protein
MSYKAIYAYAWDLAEIGAADASTRFQGLGLDTITIAGSYHAGKFLRPHGEAGKVCFPEDGTVYFRADQSRYGRIKPVGNSMLGERDVLREFVDHGRIHVNVWLVLLHNTLLGSSHPDSTVKNAFGDSYIYNLCPSAPEARAYAIGLAQDVTQAYSVSGVSMETPGFLPCTRVSSRIRAQSPQSLAGRSIGPMLLLALPERCKGRRHQRHAPEGEGRRRHRWVSWQ